MLYAYPQCYVFVTGNQVNKCYRAMSGLRQFPKCQSHWAMVGRQSFGSPDEDFTFNSLIRRLEESRSIPEDPQSTARQGAPWVIPESTDDNSALDDTIDEYYTEYDAPLEGLDQHRPWAGLPSALRAGVGGRDAANRGGNRGGRASRYHERSRPYDAIVEGLQDRLQAESRAAAAAAATAGPRSTNPSGIPGRVTKRPSPNAAERARRRALERNMLGVPFLSTSDSEFATPTPGIAASNSIRHSSSYRGRQSPSRFPRFERNLRDKLRSGRYDEDAIRYYLDMASQYGVSRGYPPEFGNLDAMLSDDARPVPEGTIGRKWTPTKVLGSGSYGEVILWQRITSSGTVS